MSCFRFLVCAASVFTFAAQATASQPPAGEGAKSREAHFSSPILQVKPTLEIYRGNAAVLRSRPELSALLASASGQWEIHMDARNDRPHLVRGPGIPLLPASVEGRFRLATEARPSQPLRLEDVEGLLRDFMATDDVLRVSTFDLRLNRQASHGDGAGRHGWTAVFDQYHENVRVDGATARFHVRHGRIVEIGVDQLGPVKVGGRPEVKKKDGLSGGLDQAGLGDPSEILESGSLRFVPVLTQGERAHRRFTGQRGEGYDHRLTWQYRFRLESGGAIFKMLVDAHSGELLELEGLSGGLEDAPTRGSTSRLCAVREDFEAGAAGWTTGGDCATGTFVVGTPSRQRSTIRTQVRGDHSTGSGQALFTAANSSAGTSDVDGGACIVTSPVYAVKADSDVSVWYFHGQRDSGDDAADGFRLEVSIDGGSFTPLVEIGDVRTVAAWSEATTPVAAGSTLQLRVQAVDGAGAGDVIEAGIDDVTVCSR